MKSTEKNYIGKGNQINDYDMFTISLDITKAKEFFFEFEGKTYLKFTFTKMQKADVKGRAFTAYVQEYTKPKSINDVVKETNAKAAKNTKKSKKSEPNFQMQH